ncbi:MAG: FAD-dependent oxidoreductase [Planctomycetota bacterium]
MAVDSAHAHTTPASALPTVAPVFCSEPILNWNPAFLIWNTVVACLILLASTIVAPAAEPATTPAPTETTPVSAKTTPAPTQATSHDVVIYGGTAAAVTAAIQTRRMGKSVLVVSPDKHLGGLSSGGLGWTDSGKKQAIGGLAREFYRQVWQHYEGSDDAWPFQRRQAYGKRSQGDPSDLPGAKTMWVFEPHVAEAIFDRWVREHDLQVIRQSRLDRSANGVVKQDARIVAIRTLDGALHRGKMFIDATYEGDLVAAAGVTTTLGRESNDTYGETFNGNQVGVYHHAHFFKQPIEPYRIPGDPDSGLLPEIDDSQPGIRGQGDHRIQAYCFRMCLTDVDENRIPFAKPEGYDPDRYELLRRVFKSGWSEVFRKFDPLPNRKTDTNNHGPFSTDYIGKNYDYPTATYARRKEIIRDHERYQKGLMYFLANDPGVPQAIRDKMNRWGLCKDEFVDNGGWPHQLYIREARRMVGQYVMTELDCLDKRETPDSVGMGSYTLDSHNVRRYVTAEGFVQNEGDIGVRTPRPYEIAYGAVIPQRDECENLLVPVCVSSSHIAFGSIRMEPVFMILGQSAATAAALAIDGNCSVQDVPIEALQKRLLADGQILQWSQEASGSASRGLAIKRLPGFVMDDDAADVRGEWKPSHATGSFVGDGYRHNQQNRDATAEYVFQVPAGDYDVRVSYSPHANRCRRVRYALQNGTLKKSWTLDQRRLASSDSGKNQPFVSLGRVSLTGDVVVRVQGDDSGYTIIDAIQLLPQS